VQYLFDFVENQPEDLGGFRRRREIERQGKHFLERAVRGIRGADREGVVSDGVLAYLSHIVIFTLH
jgi:hypothetical protein